MFSDYNEPTLTGPHDQGAEFWSNGCCLTMADIVPEWLDTADDV